MASTHLVFALLPALALMGCDDKGAGDSGAAGSDGASGLDCVEGYCTLPSEILADLTLTADYAYVLSSGVRVGDGVSRTTLTIEPGVTIYGEPQSFLAIQQGSQIFADGTAEAPIVFTSPQLEGSRNRADWGGLILNGKAPINNCSDGTSESAGCSAEGEGGTGTYGGDDPNDSSGSLTYVRVEFGGYEITPENEVNGIAFQGVGAGTQASYLQVHMNKDDAIEFYGGTVSADHLVLSGAGDDSLDWTDGWTGTVDHVLIVQESDLADRGIEADNNGDQNAALPMSNPTLSNVTILGAGSESVGVLLREGTGATLTDVVVQGSGAACFDVDQRATFDNAESGSLSVSFTALSCDSYFMVESGDAAESFDIQEWFEGQDGNFTTVNPGLADWMPNSDSTLVGKASDGSTIGAFEPGDDWTAGWTLWATN